VGARVSKLDKSAFTDAEMQNIMGADSAAVTLDPRCQRRSNLLKMDQGG
jgi:hypothetical protein